MKTNKSYTKRLKVTKNGKLIARRPGQNHFNAKDSSKSRMHKHRSQEIILKHKNRGRFIPYN
ncbi:50S ribosomal protein L35 [Candidatus Kaiserbacteria bacterium]|nr:50S ribosomal protein L35 [Candidatus Kaiserbacteria bacterium]